MSTVWQETIYSRLLERDRQEKAHAGLIQELQVMASQVILLSQRNALLLQASSSSSGAKPTSANGPSAE